MEKAYPENSHMDYYSVGGWVYLGQTECKEHGNKIVDLYVNHDKQWISVVFSNEPSDYASGEYYTLFSKLDTQEKASKLEWMLNSSVIASAYTVLYIRAHLLLTKRLHNKA